MLHWRTRAPMARGDAQIREPVRVRVCVRTRASEAVAGLLTIESQTCAIDVKAGQHFGRRGIESEDDLHVTVGILA